MTAGTDPLLRRQTGPERLARGFALVIGVAFVLAGVGGFVPAVTPPAGDLPQLAVPAGYGLLLGLYPVNAVHNVVHLALGIAGLLAYRGLVPARGYARVLAVILAGFTVMGLVPAWHTMHGAMPLFGHDVWLHGLEAMAAGYVGLRRGRTEVADGHV